MGEAITITHQLNCGGCKVAMGPTGGRKNMRLVWQCPSCGFACLGPEVKEVITDPEVVAELRAQARPRG